MTLTYHFKSAFENFMFSLDENGNCFYVKNNSEKKEGEFPSIKAKLFLLTFRNLISSWKQENYGPQILDGFELKIEIKDDQTIQTKTYINSFPENHSEFNTFLNEVCNELL